MMNTPPPDSTELEDATRQWMELWHKQMALMLQDPASHQTAPQWWQAAAASSFPSIPGFSPFSPSPAAPQHDTSPASTPASTPSGTPTADHAGVADVAILRQLLELQSRLAACEARLHQLESRLESTGETT